MISTLWCSRKHKCWDNWIYTGKRKTICKNELELDQRSNVRAKTIEILEGNRRVNFWQRFLDMTPKSQIEKKLGFIKQEKQTFVLQSTLSRK